MVTITCIVVLYEGKILSWKTVARNTDGTDLSSKYFHPVGRDKTEIIVQKFNAKENNEELWNKSKEWMKKYEIHPILQRDIDNNSVWAPY